MFAYCGNSPVNYYDPTGDLFISISTIILIGSIVAGIAAAAVTAYVESEAGIDTVQVIGDSVCAGLATFSVVYSGGMTLYQCYQNYCYLNALTPATGIGSVNSATIGQKLQGCANSANAAIPGSGSVVGTQKHSLFAEKVNGLGIGSIRTEVSYLNGAEVPYGTKGSVRFDVIQFNDFNQPIAAWDFKTGNATLTAARIAAMLTQSGLDIPIYMIK